MTETLVPNEFGDQQWASSCGFPNKESAIGACSEIFRLLKEEGFPCTPFFVGVDGRDYLVLVGEVPLHEQTRGRIIKILAPYSKPRRMHYWTHGSTVEEHPIVEALLKANYEEFQKTRDIMCLSFAYFT